jgi:hypothetical protein
MSPRRSLIALAWISTLSLLAWAATPGASHPAAPAWERTTFATRLDRARAAAPAVPAWLAAEPGGYAAVPARGGRRPWTSASRAPVDPEVAEADARRSGDYVDLGR